MMEPRTTGIRAQVYAAAYDDPATQAAARVLEAGGVPAYVSALVVVTATHRLDCWALQDGDEGRTDHLADARLVDLAWPESAAGPRKYGRGDKLGKTLRAALHAGGFLVRECTQSAANPGGILHASCTHPGCHEHLHTFKMRHGKLLADRKRWREKAAASREEHRVPPPGLARVAGGPTTIQGEGTREGPPAPRAPRGPVAGLVEDALAHLLADAPFAEDPDPAGGGYPVAAVPPRAAACPAAGGKGEGGIREGAARQAVQLLATAEPNTREQVRHGRDLTLRPGRTYLFRLGMAAPGIRAALEGEVGRDPLPGRLLHAAAPDRMELAVRLLANKLRTELRGKPTRTLEGYARSMLADHWGKYLDALSSSAERQALEDHGQRPASAGGRHA